MPRAVGIAWTSAVLTCVTLAGMPLPAARAITPDTPRVRDAVKAAVKFLDATDDKRLGARALVGLTLAKSGADPKHPKIADAVRAIQGALAKGPEQFNADIYSTGISIMFLVELDPSRYRYEIEGLARSLHLRQKAHGAWGYPLTHAQHAGTCDTSMTQYAVLGLWEAEELAGVQTPRLVWDRVARWLLLTQDPNGGFGYQGEPSTRLGRTVNQAGVRHSMTVAALGSIYIVKDRVGITQLQKSADDDTPDALQPYESPDERAARIKTNVDLRHFARALADGNRWVEENYNVEDLKSWIHYSLYALERYESLREASNAGREVVEKTDQSKWYNRGARYLLQTQKPDGSWESEGGPVPDTCFGALFLMGSMRKTLATASAKRFRAGLMVGGQGLPETPNVRVRDGQVVVQPWEATLDQVLAAAGNEQAPHHAAAIERLADCAAHAAPEQLESSARALIRLALDGPPLSRQLAVRCLGTTRNLDYGPWLIHLLGDEDLAVAQEAERALARIGRRPTMLDNKSLTSAQREEAGEAWKIWYQRIRPDVDLDSFDVHAPDLLGAKP